MPAQVDQPLTLPKHCTRSAQCSRVIGGSIAIAAMLLSLFDSHVPAGNQAVVVVCFVRYASVVAVGCNYLATKSFAFTIMNDADDDFLPFVQVIGDGVIGFRCVEIEHVSVPFDPGATFPDDHTACIIRFHDNGLLAEKLRGRASPAFAPAQETVDSGLHPHCQRGPTAACLTRSCSRQHGQRGIWF